MRKTKKLTLTLLTLRNLDGVLAGDVSAEGGDTNATGCCSAGTACNGSGGCAGAQPTGGLTVCVSQVCGAAHTAKA